MVLGSSSVVAQTARDCAHCGLPVETEPAHDAPAFCCAACNTAWTLVHEHGLEAYYALPERRRAAVVPSSRTYEEFDHPTFWVDNVAALSTSLQQVVLGVHGVHCASCVWLIERMPLIVPGVLRAELDVVRSRVHLEWDARVTSLSTVAQTLASLGYPPHANRGDLRESARIKDDRRALAQLGIAGAIAINVMLAAIALYAGWFSGGIERSYETYFRWLSLALVALSIAGPGRVFFSSAWNAAKHRMAHLDLPIAIALGAGFLRGTVNTWRGRGPVYFDGVAVLIFLLLVGRYLQQRWRRAMSDASELLRCLTPSCCRVVDKDGRVREVPVEALVPGMVLDVRVGDTIAVDGVVIGGASAISEAWLTGESNARSVEPGDTVYAGSVNVSAPTRVRATSTGESTRVAQLLELVEATAKRRAPVVLLANRVAAWFTPITIGLAIVTWGIWVRVDPSTALDNAIALLVVTCPCALAMATPLSMHIALGRAAAKGVLIKGGDAIQALAGQGRIFLDKTGTLTLGQCTLQSWNGPVWVQPLILSLEAGSVHPVAEGFRRAWGEHDVAQVDVAEHSVGGGIAGVVGGHRVCVGSHSFVGRTLSSHVTHHVRSGLTPVLVSVDGVIVGEAGFGDHVREDSAAALSALRTRGWSPTMLSGDAHTVCHTVAGPVGLSPPEVISDSSPNDKRAIVAQARVGAPAIMVGDGVNDAAAMAAASVGIAVHGGAEVALAAADVYLTKQGLTPVVELIDGARRTMATVRRNIAFSLCYNAVGVALAMLGLISPLAAAILMPVSSFTVLASAWYSRAFKDPV